MKQTIARIFLGIVALCFLGFLVQQFVTEVEARKFISAVGIGLLIPLAIYYALTEDNDT